MWGNKVKYFWVPILIRIIFLFKIPSIIVKGCILQPICLQKSKQFSFNEQEIVNNKTHSLTFWSATCKILLKKNIKVTQQIRDTAHLKNYHLLLHNFRFALWVYITTSWSFTMQIHINSTRSFLCKCLQMHNQAQRIKSMPSLLHRAGKKCLLR